MAVLASWRAHRRHARQARREAEERQRQARLEAERFWCLQLERAQSWPQEMLLFLDAVCDGAWARDCWGFSQDYRDLGHGLATNHLHWNAEECDLAGDVIRVYQKQLWRAGFAVPPSLSRYRWTGFPSPTCPSPEVWGREGWHPDLLTPGTFSPSRERWWNGARWTHDWR